MMLKFRKKKLVILLRILEFSKMIKINLRNKLKNIRIKLIKQKTRNINPKKT